jgi:LmbE family N-acetylglucosaminyl deacetylase
MTNLLNNIGSKKVLLCFPHPDDEIYVGGILLQQLCLHKIDFEIICLTQGGAGKNFSSDERNLKNIRMEEFKNGLKSLGISEKYKILDYPDSLLSQHEIDIYNYLNEIIISNRYEVVISYDNNGMTGHPDHILVSKVLFQLSKDLGFEFYGRTFNLLGKYTKLTPAKKNYYNNPEFYIDCDNSLKLNKFNALMRHVSQFNNLKSKIYFLDVFTPKEELFFLFDKEKMYNFDYIDFKI